MSNLSSEIFKKYGLSAIIIAAVVTVIVWGVAHLAATPGTEVSVLYGLVRYTKAPVSPMNEISSGGAARQSNLKGEFKGLHESPRSALDSLGPASVEIINDVTPANSSRVIHDLMLRYKVRELSTLESGKTVGELAPNTFFYLSPVYLSTYNLEEPYSTSVLHAPTERFLLRPDQQFLVFLLPDSNTTLLGFAGQEVAVSISHLGGTEEHNFVFAPRVVVGMSSLVLLPTKRIISSKFREIQIARDSGIIVLDLTIK